MHWESLFFILFLYPIIKNILIYLSGKSEYIKQKNKEKQDALTKEKRLINSSLRILIFVIPYFGAFYYAEFKYLWLILGVIYLLTALITLSAALTSQSFRNENPDKYNDAVKESRASLKDVDFWPKWQVHALCFYNVSILALWIYSWRYLYT